MSECYKPHKEGPSDACPWCRIDALAAELARCREALIQCKEKLDTYRDAWGPEYLGGVEYSVLVKRIKAALAGATEGASGVTP